MMTKSEYMTRPEDINLGPIWNSMRTRQRELSWPTYWMNCQMAQAKPGSLFPYDKLWLADFIGTDTSLLSDSILMNPLQ